MVRDLQRLLTRRARGFRGFVHGDVGYRVDVVRLSRRGPVSSAGHEHDSREKYGADSLDGIHSGKAFRYPHRQHGRFGSCAHFIKFRQGDAVINTNSYKKAGVDIEAGAELVERIKPLAGSTDRSGVMGGLGGFGGLFDLKAAGFEDPILVAATDGVGTKLKIAIETGRHDTVGIDLVAMCVNDLVVQGAEPLFFLDYYATGALNPAAAASVVDGIAEGCRQAGCALIGGETAEMPGMYAKGDYDLAGFAVGAAERTGLLPRTDIAPGDVILGMASSGLHSNGFSLVRHLLAGLETEFTDPSPLTPGTIWADELLTPTRIYVRACLAALKTGKLKGLAHITGGGLPENVPRVLPDGMAARIDPAAWDMPPVFRWLMDEGDIAAAEMARAFNCGIGMIAIVNGDDAGAVAGALRDAGETVWEIGTVEDGPERGDRVALDGLESAWRG